MIYLLPCNISFQCQVNKHDIFKILTEKFHFQSDIKPKNGFQIITKGTITKHSHEHNKNYTLPWKHFRRHSWCEH